jgi:hypothetical protein
MKFLPSVDCFIDEKDMMIYEKDSYGVPNISEGKSIKDMNDDWWDRLDPSDLSRIDMSGGLF